ncbi:hypothetical protein [Haloarcula laminariae]|uniref:hypothetical protein n=1 Tax=Haloarcula laminariae TaxID=2961577 RepID=UPI0024061D21|nr:hypothetical protein [Halomicroarcula sp. FL173]
MTKPNWYIVLEQFYEADGRVDIWERTDDEGRFKPNNEFWSETELNANELSDAVRYLEDAKLIDTGFNGVSLTNDGFKAVYERRSTRTQTGLNRALVALTLILALGTVVQTAIEVASQSEPGYLPILLLAGETLIFGAIYSEMYRRGLLDFDD